MVVNDVEQRKTATSTFYVFILFFIRYLPNYCNFVAYVSLCRPNATLKLFYLYSCSLVPYFISKSCHLLLEDDTSAPWHRKDSAKYFSPSELDGRFIWNFEAALSESVSAVLE